MSEITVIAGVFSASDEKEISLPPDSTGSKDGGAPNILRNGEEVIVIKTGRTNDYC